MLTEIYIFRQLQRGSTAQQRPEGPEEEVERAVGKEKEEESRRATKEC